MLIRSLPMLGFSLTLTLTSGPAQAQVDLRWAGKVQSDLRFRTETKGFGRWRAELDRVIEIGNAIMIFASIEFFG